MQRVAFLHERDHGIRFAAGRFHRRHRMVAMGVETLALRRTDFPDVGALERRSELLQGQLDPVAQASRLVFSLPSAACRLSSTGRSCSAKRSSAYFCAADASACARLRAFSASATARSSASRCCSSLACASASNSASGLSLLWDGSVCVLCSCMPSKLGMGGEAFKPGLAISVKLLNY